MYLESLPIQQLGGGFFFFEFSSLPGEMIQFDEHVFQMGWFNHQLGSYFSGEAIPMGFCSWIIAQIEGAVPS